MNNHQAKTYLIVFAKSFFTFNQPAEYLKILDQKQIKHWYNQISLVGDGMLIALLSVILKSLSLSPWKMQQKSTSAE